MQQDSNNQKKGSSTNVNWKKVNGIITRQNREKARKKSQQQASLNTANVMSMRNSVLYSQPNKIHCFDDTQAYQQFGVATQQYRPSYNQQNVQQRKNVNFDLPKSSSQPNALVQSQTKQNYNKDANNINMSNNTRVKDGFQVPKLHPQNVQASSNHMVLMKPGTNRNFQLKF